MLDNRDQDIDRKDNSPTEDTNNTGNDSLDSGSGNPRVDAAKSLVDKFRRKLRLDELADLTREVAEEVASDVKKIAEGAKEDAIAIKDDAVELVQRKREEFASSPNERVIERRSTTLAEALRPIVAELDIFKEAVEDYDDALSRIDVDGLEEAKAKCVIACSHAGLDKTSLNLITEVARSPIAAGKVVARLAKVKAPASIEGVQQEDLLPIARETLQDPILDRTMEKLLQTDPEQED